MHPRHRLAALALLLALLLSGAPERARAATIPVISPADSGPGTLRAALTAARDGDTILFDRDVFTPPGDYQTILLLSPLPAITASGVTIDAVETRTVLNGASAGPGASGLVIRGSGCTVMGLIIERFAQHGVLIESGAEGTVIGGLRDAGPQRGGQGNRITGNGGSGVEISAAHNNTVIGNFIGVIDDGRFAFSNKRNGVTIWEGRGNTVGGVAPGAGNVISGNGESGVWIAGDGALSSGNHVLGNIIGPSSDGQRAIGQGHNGVTISGNASGNTVGGPTTTHGNQIAANAIDGVRIGANASANVVQSNLIGTNASGDAALPNGLHGVEITENAWGNQIGGPHTSGLSPGNVLSGNGNHGLVILFGAHSNTVQGNIIGPDITGLVSLRRQPFGGIDIAEGADNNLVEGNVISGNTTDGVALFDNTGRGTDGNQIVGNWIGVARTGAPLPNVGQGVLVGNGAAGTRVANNTIAHNTGFGVLIGPCGGNALADNVIVDNRLRGIKSDCPLPEPQILSASLGAPATVTGTAPPGTRVLVYSDGGDDMALLESPPEGVPVTAAGAFTFTTDTALRGPNITVRAVTPAGESSSLSEQVRLDWTILLYLNGDNNLAEDMDEVVASLAAAGASPGAHVLALVDGAPSQGARGGTRLYDLTRGTPVQISPDAAPFLAPGELNMGDPRTLTAFYEWGADTYPARHRLLAIVDHGGGWAPSATLYPPGVLPIHRKVRISGGSGLSWDETGGADTSDTSDDADYLDSKEMATALATINGHRALDVLFYDVCLMGMVEVAYQASGSATFLVSSQNIGWSPVGEEGRYVRLVQGLTSSASPQQMAERLVAAYGAGLPPAEHPYTIAAVRLAALGELRTAMDALTAELIRALDTPGGITDLRRAYLEAQKIDYDSDLVVEPDTDGFVDIKHFAQRVAANFAAPAVDAAAARVAAAIDAAVVARGQRSEAPWSDPDRRWELDNTNGLSVFLPFGEDLRFDVTDTAQAPGATPSETAELRLLDLYNADELRFVRDSQWRALIDTYYQRYGSGRIPTVTKVRRELDGLQVPDVDPPEIAISLEGEVRPGQAVTLRWSATDAQSGVLGARLYRQQVDGSWLPVGSIVRAESGAFTVEAESRCIERYGVFATDNAGNEARPRGGSEEVNLYPLHCAALPYALRDALGSRPPTP